MLPWRSCERISQEKVDQTDLMREKGRQKYCNKLGVKRGRTWKKTQKPFKKSAAKRGVEAVQESETEEEDVKQPRRTRFF